MADAHNDKGKAAFSSRDYEAAIRHFGDAITAAGAAHANPRSEKEANMYNNRAAAALELIATRSATIGASRKKELAEQAQEDAERATKYLTNSAKAYSRVARAESLLGRKQLALDAARRAVALEPANDFYVSLRAAIERDQDVAIMSPLGGGPSGGSARFPGAAAAAAGGDSAPTIFKLDLAVVGLAVAHLLAFLVSPSMGFTLWRLACFAMAGRQYFGLVEQVTIAPGFAGVRGLLSRAGLSALTSTLYGQFFVLSLTMLLLSPPPQQLLLGAFALYCVLDLCTRHWAQFEATVVARIPAFLDSYITQRLRALQANSGDARRALLLQAAMLEIFSLVTAPFTGAPMLIFVYFQFVKARYATDANVRMVFTALHHQLTNLTRHPRCPQVVARGYDAFSGIVSRFG